MNVTRSSLSRWLWLGDFLDFDFELPGAGEGDGQAVS